MKNTFSLLEEFQSDPQAFTWKQIKEFQKLKKAGFTKEFSVRQAEFDCKRLKLGSNSHYSLELEENSNKLKDVQGQSRDLNDRHDHYTASEKEGLDDKHFVQVDKLQAQLATLKSRLAQVNKCMSNNKNK